MDRDPPTPPDSLVELSITIASPPSEVWRAITERTDRWMGGFRMVSTWEVGAPFAIGGELHGKPYAETGAVLAFEAGKLLRYDHWSRLWRVPDTPANRAVMTIGIEPEGAGTRVRVKHELPAVEAIEPHARYFWSVALELLRKLLEQD